MPSGPEISVVVPVYDEEDNLPILHQELATALSGSGRSWECVYVDDGSRDRSLAVLLRLRAQDPRRIRVVQFARNAGQTAALAAGFDHARGEIVITLDADLQNDPADIPALVAKLDEGYDIVAGWRKQRHDGFVLRKLPSRIANRLIAWTTGVGIHDTGCTLKAFRTDLVRNLPIYAEQHRFLPAMSAGSGARVAELVVNHRPRRFGHSKYGQDGERVLASPFDLLCAGFGAFWHRSGCLPRDAHVALAARWRG
jgi:glycosyltransferase involved in cell wall biosynthesis